MGGVPAQERAQCCCMCPQLEVAQSGRGTKLGCLTSCVSVRAGKVKQEPTLYREGPPYQRRGSLQLWQFLVTLLDDPANAHFIAWTGRGMEFKLIEPEEVRDGSCSSAQQARAAAWEQPRGETGAVCGGAGSFPRNTAAHA